jgi:YVTN family beta-propeller protein
MDRVLILDMVARGVSSSKDALGKDRWGEYRQGLDTSASYIFKKLPTQSNPRRLGLSGDGKTLVVSNYLSDSLTVIDTEKLKVVKHIPLGGPEPDAARRGEILFNSAGLTQFGQFTCASCHPNGGADGLNWDLPRDGIGNFKNTKSLLGVKDTAPYGWLGTSPTLADRVAGTLRTLHRYEPSEDEVNDIVAYLETLPAPTPPLRSGLVNDEERAATERGKALFAGKARCDGCHSGPAFDDGKIHDVGTGTPGEDRFNTPSLRGLWSSAPYLHDGRAATLEEVFSKYNEKNKHGDADRLTAAELADLVAYLRSL